MSRRPQPIQLKRRTLLAAGAATRGIGLGGRRSAAQAPAEQDPWPALAGQIFDGRTLQDGSAIVAIDAPYRAEDAALEMDQLTCLYMPAHFVTSVRIWQTDELLLSIDSGISISENPEFRFDYRPNGDGVFRVELKDSEDRSFHQEWRAMRI